MDASFLERLKQRLTEFSMSQWLALAIGLSLLVGAVAGVVLWTTRPDYQVLFSRLDPEDAARIVEILKQDKIPYELQANGTAVLVPHDKVYDLRLRLASSGIPRGGGVGFEIFDTNSLGTTEFVQKLNYQRALQGELSRTISQFDSVSQARVHIVTPKESLFIDQTKPATASVVLRLRPGKKLAKQQIDGVVHLVASSVEGLDPQNITVVDMDGGVLYRGHGGTSDIALTSSQLEYQHSLQTNLEKRIQEMLERVVGEGRAVARVTAEVDYRRINISEERFDPDSAVIRSEQRQSESSSGGTTMPEGAPEDKYNFNENAATTMVSNTSAQKQNEVTNYEVSRTSKQIIGATGDIKRLSAAVIVDGTYESQKGADGKAKQVFVPRTQEEMKHLEELVKKAIGFDANRGDQVEVINLAFAEHPDQFPGSEGVGSSWLKMVEPFLSPALKVVVAVLVFLFVVRPLLRWLGQIRGIPGMGRSGESPELEHLTPESRAALPPRQQVMYLARKDPEKTAELIKGWLNEE